MSAPSKEVVLQKPIVKICLAYNFARSGGGLHIDFSHRLNWRGSDFKVYANSGYTENTGDSAMLVNIINAVMSPANGVDRVEIRAFDLRISINTTTDVEELMKQIEYAAARAGFIVEMLPSPDRLV